MDWRSIVALCLVGVVALGGLVCGLVIWYRGRQIKELAGKVALLEGDVASMRDALDRLKAQIAAGGLTNAEALAAVADLLGKWDPLKPGPG